MKTIEVYCPKCKRYITVKIEWGKSPVRMLMNQHKCKKKESHEKH
jgi:ribosomal protein L44E